MDALLHHVAISLRLHARNKMALIYSYLFPTIFLVAFWVLYRFEEVPLVRHVGELLTVTALGGACFGLPTTMVSERERGVWRRYRLTPVSTATLISGTVAARYVLLLVAGLLQLLLAMGLGMPLPKHPVELFLAFTFVCFAFIGLGLVIAMMADNVPAVQALGQCIFLPMLIIGGVAVPLASLPDWAQRLSAFFPGRYAVDAMQACVTGNGLGVAGFSVIALILIGAAGSLAGAKMFRWDSEQRFAATGGKAWVAVALAAWVAVGAMAESKGRRVASTSAARLPAPRLRKVPPSRLRKRRRRSPPVQRLHCPQRRRTIPARLRRVLNPRRSLRLRHRLSASSRRLLPSAPRHLHQPSNRPRPHRRQHRGRGATPGTSPPATWREVTMADIDRDLIFQPAAARLGGGDTNCASWRRARRKHLRTTRQDAGGPATVAAG